MPLSRPRERLAIGALTLGAFAMALNVNVIGPLGPFLEQDALYASVGEEDMRVVLGTLLSAGAFSSALAALALGPIVDRVGRRPPMLAGSALFILASLGHLWAGSHELLVVLRALAGFGVGLVFTSASAAVADIVPYARRGAAMGVFSTGIYLAIPVGLPVAVLLGNAGSWRSLFAVQAGVGLLALVGIALMIPRGLGRSREPISQLRVLRVPMVVPALLSVLLHTGAFFTVIQYVPTWLDAPAAGGAPILPRADQPYLWVGLGLCSAVGSMVLPRLSDRTGKHNFVLLASAGLSICLLLLGRVVDVDGLLLVGVPLALLASARTGPLQALMSEIVPRHMRGTLMGVRAAAIQLGAALFTGAGGFVYASSGFPRLVWLAFLATLGSYALVRLFVREPR